MRVGEGVRRVTHDPRLDAILEVLVALAKHDFGPRAPVDGTDTIDALAVGVNMLAEELDGEVASRAELETAYAELKTAQAKLVQSEKLATIGLLASGVAHEVNNPAAWVTLSLGVLRKSVATLGRAMESDDVDKAAMRETLSSMDGLLADAVEGMTRITTVVQDLRMLSRAEDRSFETISFREIAGSACRLAASVLQGTAVHFDIDDSAVIVANRGRVAQVVTNLLLNAAFAVRDAPAPAIWISTWTEGAGVLLSVEDNGPGIPHPLRERVFDAFFTTKAPSEGTGLGLAIVAQIAANAGGWARVSEPKLGTGARVDVYFPADYSAASDIESRSRPMSSATPSR